MAPNDRPANENEEPAAPRSMADRVELAVSLAILAAIPVAMFAILDAAHWLTFGIVLGVSVVCMIVAALYRLVVHGRA